jgi:diguanylate cyclase (GGDEF)-like protein
MTLPLPSLPPGQPDPRWLRRLLIVQRSCLALVLLISIVALSAATFSQLGPILRLIVPHFSAPLALTAIFCVISLWLSEPGHSPLMVRSGGYVASLAALIATVILVVSSLHLAAVPDSFLDSVAAIFTAGTMSPLTAVAFLFVSFVIIFVRSDTTLARNAADVWVSCLCLLTLILVSQDLFGALGLFGLTAADLIAPPVLCCLILLTLVVTLRQAEFGVLSIFLGAGIGSRIARGFAPILLAWPFIREIGEAQISFAGIIPSHFAASLLTSLAVAFSLALLMFIVWRINSMEAEIHDLTLRDDLTGLYNMRGFYLLGEQTLRLAQRAKSPFSVLFLDLDGLKKINDHLGHNIGSAYLKKTGELVHTNFRDADVKGRFGGDEFVVAGQFSVVGIELAASRLKALATELSQQVDPSFPLSFSIGHVTAEHYSTESLKELVVQADHAMYEDKRLKKAARA